MKILFATSEVHPLIKTGGLADVSGSLPTALKRLRNDVRIILPAYRQALDQVGKTKVAATLRLPVCPDPVRILEGRLPSSTVPVYLVDAPSYFDRPGPPYSDPNGHDWPDNGARFAAFCRAVVELAQDRAGLHWQPSIVHCNDWQSGLAPAFLARETPRPATIFTIHNLAYQGIFSRDVFAALQLPWEWWNMHGLEFHGQFSFIKGGLAFADWLTTVSPTYAREIRTKQYGYGLEGLLQSRSDRLIGILNGADYEHWDPAHDPALVQNYSTNNLRLKLRNKHALQQAFHLPQDQETPLLAYVGRLAEQKGIDLILEVLPTLMQQPVQMVILGTGAKHFEDALEAAAHHYPNQLSVRIGYDEALAHQIEAGADMFLMPSRYEPCGLNQIYSLRYGTVPIVRRTGGLADTVVDVTARTTIKGTATGFVFDDPTAASFLSALQRALHAYGRPSSRWRKLAITGMEEDFSWTISAREYLELYQETIAAVA